MNRARSARRTSIKPEAPKLRSTKPTLTKQKKWHPWTYVLLLFLINWIAYSNSFKTGWHFDDGPNIIGNPDIQISDLSWKSLLQAASTSPGGKRPISYLSFAANYYVWGEDAFSFHVVNFLIHILNALLVFRVFSTLLLKANPQRETHQVWLLSSLAAALWSVNPIQTQPVLYVVQRMTLLAALFSLLSFYWYVQWRAGTRPRWYSLLSLAAWLLAVGSKENAFLLPLSFLVYEWLFTDRKLLRLRNLAVGITASACLVGFTIARYDLVKKIETDYSGREFTMKERLLTQPRIVAFHLSQLVVPLPTRLALRHEVEKSTSWIAPPTTILSILFLGALFWMAFVLRRKQPLVCFGISWFFANLLVESTFLPLEMIYEHRIYLPSVGLFLALAQAVVVLLKHQPQISNKHLPYAFSLLILCSGALSFRRNQDWLDEISLWSDNVQKYPASFRSWNNLGTAYIKSGQPSMAEKAFQRAMESEPEYPPARVNLAILWKNEGKVEEAYSLIKDFRETKIGTFSAEIYYNMGAIFAGKGILDSAIFHYGQAVNRMPDYPEAHFNLALVYRRAGKNAEARQSFQRFLNYWRGPSDSPFVAEAKRSFAELP